MAGGQLVPHQLPDGRWVKVPDYLLPAQPALALPNVPPPPAAPDARLALGPTPRMGSGQQQMLGDASSDFRQVLDVANSPAAPIAAPSVLPGAVVSIPHVPENFQQETPEQEQTAANAAKLKQVPKTDPRQRSGVINQTVDELYGKKPGGPARPGPVDPSLLQPVVAEIKQERVPGQRILPEQAWAMGIEQRPKELYELDPNAEQPTWGTEEPVMREKLTPLEQGAEKAGQFARTEYEQQVDAARQMGNVQRAALVEQSQAIDSQLAGIAERRQRIAQLQETADRRMQEAESQEPRTRGEIWESKGNLARGTAILAAVLSGAAAGLQGRGGSPAWEAIERSIDDDVKGEQYKFERRMRLGLEAKGDLARAHALYGDLDIATLETKQRKTANLLATTQQMLADRSLDMNARARGEQVYAAGKAAFLENQRQLMDALTGKVVKEEATLKPYGQVIQTATPKAVGGGGGTGKPGISGDKLKGLSAEVRSLAVKMPDGRYKFARSAEEKKDIQNKMVVAKTMIDRLRQLQAFRADKSNTIPWTKKRGQLEAIGADLLRLGKSKDAMGTLDKGLIEFSQRQFGKPEEFNIADETIDGKLAQGITMLQDEVRRTSESFLDDGPFELTEGGVSEQPLEQ